jgi:hypothetical protein
MKALMILAFLQLAGRARARARVESGQGYPVKYPALYTRGILDHRSDIPFDHT